MGTCLYHKRIKKSKQGVLKISNGNGINLHSVTEGTKDILLEAPSQRNEELHPGYNLVPFSKIVVLPYTLRNN